jgi:hypothetical protein
MFDLKFIQNHLNQNLDLIYYLGLWLFYSKMKTL